jgi:hypothetical protein
VADKDIILGYFGNIWLKKNILHKAGSFSDTHYHLFDHVSFLVKGEIDIEIDGKITKTFQSPGIVIVPKDKPHRIIAKTDNVEWYCVFAVRDDVGGVVEVVPPDWYPYYIDTVPSDYWEKRKQLENLSIDVDHQPHKSWIWDKELKKWRSPKPYPIDGKLHEWNESLLEWTPLHDDDFLNFSKT